MSEGAARCGTCLYFVDGGSERYDGLCYADPPKVFVFPDRKDDDPDGICSLRPEVREFELACRLFVRRSGR